MIRVVSYFDELYAPLFKIMLTSFLKQNKWFNDEISVYDWGISDKTKSEVLKIYNKIEFLDVDKSKYDLSDSVLDKFYFGKNFQKFELFKLKFEKIIIFDADLVFLGDVKELFENYNDGLYVDPNEPTELEPIVPYPDTGLMVIDKKYLTLENYNKCLEHMKDELLKDISKDSTRVSNEWVFHHVFKDEMKPISDHLRISDIEQDLTNQKILGTPEYKPLINDNRYMKFVEKDLLPWRHDEEILRHQKFIALLKKQNLWQLMGEL